MGWAGANEGLRHWDTKAIGGAINQVYANSVEEKAKEAAKKKYDEQVAALQKEYAAGQEAQKADNSTPQPRALPTQGDGPVTADTGVDAVSAAQPAAIKPMTKAQYESRLRDAENTYKNDQSQARIDYYKARGMDEERIKAEDALKNDKFHQGMLNKYYAVMDGDAQATSELVGYMNASMGGGNRIVQNDDGTMSLMQGDKVLQANFKPTTAQINEAFTGMYNTAKFFHDNDFEGLLSRNKSMQEMALGNRAADLADKKFGLDIKKYDLDKFVQNEKLQQAWKSLGLDEAKLKQAAQLFYDGQSFEALQAALNREHETNLQKGDQTFKAEEAGRQRTHETNLTNTKIAAEAARQEDAQAHELGITNLKLGVEKAIADATNKLKERGVAVNEAKVALDYQKYADKIAEDNANKSIPYVVDDYDANLGAFVGRLKNGAGEGTGDVIFYQSGPGKPRIPAGMTEEQYAANAEGAKRIGADYITFFDRKSARYVAAFRLPNGDVTEDFEKAKAIMKNLGKAIPEQKSSAPARAAIPEQYSER